MANDLMGRLDELHKDLNTADELAQAALLDQLDQIVMSLEAAGQKVPVWTRSWLAERAEAEVEDMFDNMPV
jgi:hypothetical protein